MRCPEEVELLLEGFRSDLFEMQLQLRSIQMQIEDARDFVKAYQVNIIFVKEFSL